MPYYICENKECSSADTLIYSYHNDSLYLIEFKEGWPRHKDKTDSNSDIRLKCYDSISKLCLFWVNILGKPRKDFFDLKINYCLILKFTLKHYFCGNFWNRQKLKISKSKS